ncbi:RNA-binding protein, contains TRAM domain protein [Halostagnicola sp. A56]|uniref:TRAM domain-containing protein n=1 Tax=Halostagnicola sp. A56 TaxID=1495067 RepID=UPI0004A17EF8|nr:RNA-binding protein [Halostagnicola sp. A56]KDE58461.1 RNA-binding protein, contains TRAM domain protein [Halostagnicola sp. A56]
MIVPVSLALGVIVVLVVGSWLIKRFRGPSSDRQDSLESHKEAQEREPPVDIGDERTVGVEEFTEHHSGERQAVTKVEGFVVFVEDLPSDVDVADAIEIKITSFNRGHTSATATCLGRA